MVRRRPCRAPRAAARAEATRLGRGRDIGESAITPFLAAYYLLCLVAVVVAWLKGGHVERLAAAVMLVAFAVSFLLPSMRMWNVYFDHAVRDVGVMLFFGWLAVSRDRWWPLAMTAVMALTVLVHVSIFLVPGLGAYAEISARIGLGILMALVLLAGAGERWLAGERAVSDLRGGRADSPS